MKKDKKIKEKRVKKKLPPEINMSLWTIFFIIVTLGITLPLHFVFPYKLTSYWVIAIFIAVINPFALATLKVFMEVKGHYTEKQMKV